MAYALCAMCCNKVSCEVLLKRCVSCKMFEISIADYVNTISAVKVCDTCNVMRLVLWMYVTLCVLNVKSVF